MMAQVLRSPSHFPSSASTTATSPITTAASSPSSSSSSCAPRPSLSCAAPPAGYDALLSAPDSPPSIAAATDGYDDEEDSDGCDGRGGSGGELAKGRERRDCAGGNDGGGGGGGEQLSLLALLLTIFRKSLIACKSDRREICTMEIGWPTNVRHVAHVTFDRFHGFLGLPVEFEPEVPSRAPSASTRVFGVSTESMQLSYDSRGNSVPTILLLLQQRLYAQGGLQAEGIFRINAENGQEEHVRDQLNRGVLPEGIDTHCLAGLIKAWFRELPTGVLDSLSPERVMQSQTEDECAELVRFLPPTEAALLNWAINLMADVVQMEHLNKMNARNIAMVFAPNMTQMADPLTALMYAVQVMNFLKTLIMRTLREREDPKIEPAPVFDLEPFDESGHQSPQPCQADDADGSEGTEQVFTSEDPDIDNSSNFDEKTSTSQAELCGWMETTEVNIMKGETETGSFYGIDMEGRGHEEKSNFGRSNAADFEEAPRKMELHQPAIQVIVPVEKSRVIDIGGLSCINSRTEWIEAWR